MPGLIGDVDYYPRAGRERMAGMSRVPGSPLVFAVELPVDRVLAPARVLLVQFGLIGAGIIVVGLVAAWILSKRITDPLVRLKQAAVALAKGETPTAPLPADRTDEIGALTRTFETMAAVVERARQDLERKVEERTAALTRAQEDLVRQERLATLGHLASGVGHELRNPLAVMSNAVYLLDATLDHPPGKASDYLAMLRRQIGLANKIVADLLDFARTRPPERRLVDVASFVDEQLDRIDLPPGIRLVREVDPELPTVNADPVQVGQVVFNLLTNALQSMDGRPGVLTVRGRAQNGSVSVEVGDTGPGVPEEIRDRIFDPLFTTRSRGIGLGLSVSRILARANQGDISLSDEERGGAWFILELPAAR
jgi:signal transduction histidine kinase